MFYRETEFMKAESWVPKGWTAQKLGQITESVKGRKPKILIEDQLEGYLPYLSTGYLRSNEKTKFTKASAESALVDYGDLILLWDGSNAGEFFLGKKGVLSSTMVKLKLKDRAISQRYLFYLMKLKEPYLQSLTRGTGIPHVDRAVFESLLVSIAPIQEQRRIAEVLSCVDLAIQKTNKVIAKTERLKKGLMQKLLTEGIGHRSFRNTQIGKIPKEWDIVPFGKIVDRLKRGPSQRTNNEGNGYVYLTSGYLTDDGFINFENLRYLDNGKVDDINKYLLEPNNLLINCVNSYEKVGKVAVFQGYKRKVMVGFNNFAVALKTIVNPSFLKYVLLQDKYKAIFRGISKAAVQQVSFSSKDLFRVKVPLPRSLEEQQSIVDILLIVDKKIELYRKERTNMERIKQGLMDLLLTGKVRVKVD